MIVDDGMLLPPGRLSPVDESAFSKCSVHGIRESAWIYDPLSVQNIFVDFKVIKHNELNGLCSDYTCSEPLKNCYLVNLQVK